MRNKRLSTQLDRWLQRPIGVGPMNTWLRDQGSLTKRLKARYADFSVKVMATKISRPASDEAKILGIANGSMPM